MATYLNYNNFVFAYLSEVCFWWKTLVNALLLCNECFSNEWSFFFL